MHEYTIPCVTGNLYLILAIHIFVMKVTLIKNPRDNKLEAQNLVKSTRNGPHTLLFPPR